MAHRSGGRTWACAACSSPAAAAPALNWGSLVYRQKLELHRRGGLVGAPAAAATSQSVTCARHMGRT